MLTSPYCASLLKSFKTEAQDFQKEMPQKGIAVFSPLDYIAFEQISYPVFYASFQILWHHYGIPSPKWKLDPHLAFFENQALHDHPGLLSIPLPDTTLSLIVPPTGWQTLEHTLRDIVSLQDPTVGFSSNICAKRVQMGQWRQHLVQAVLGKSSLSNEHTWDRSKEQQDHHQQAVADAYAVLCDIRDHGNDQYADLLHHINTIASVLQENPTIWTKHTIIAAQQHGMRLFHLGILSSLPSTVLLQEAKRLADHAALSLKDMQDLYAIFRGNSQFSARPLDQVLHVIDALPTPSLVAKHYVEDSKISCQTILVDRRHLPSSQHVEHLLAAQCLENPDPQHKSMIFQRAQHFLRRMKTNGETMSEDAIYDHDKKRFIAAAKGAEQTLKTLITKESRLLER